MDTKKKELVGDFKNAGRTWRPRGQPEEVRVHDFKDPVLGKAIPYGVYDLLNNQGWVSVGRAATALRETFARSYRRVCPKAVECLERDWDRMVAYYAFRQEHWKHLRTTNIIESPFAAVRLRTSTAKRFKKVDNATTLIWKTLLVVEQHFRKLNAPHLCTAVYDGIVFNDGVRTITPTRARRAA